MTAREEFATTLRKSKKKQVIENKRALKFAKSPFDSCDKPKPGSFMRFDKMPLLLLGNLISTQTPFNVMVDKWNSQYSAMITDIPAGQ